MKVWTMPSRGASSRHPCPHFLPPGFSGVTQGAKIVGGVRSRPVATRPWTDCFNCP